MGVNLKVQNKTNTKVCDRIRRPLISKRNTEDTLGLKRKIGDALQLNQILIGIRSAKVCVEKNTFSFGDQKGSLACSRLVTKKGQQSIKECR